MARFMKKDDPATGPQQPVWYELKGVLMHKGKSAYHGHYVAQVHDVEGKWFLFDDELVSPIDDLNAPGKWDEEEDDVVVGPSKKKAKAAGQSKEFPREPDGTIRPRSKDAYMLIYTRMAGSPEGDAMEQDEQVTGPPPLAAARVEALDAEHLKAAEAWEAEAAVVREKFEAARADKRSVYQHFQLGPDDTAGVLVSRSSLSSWIAEGLGKKKPVSSSAASAPRSGQSVTADQEMVDLGSDGPPNSTVREGTIPPGLVASDTPHARSMTPTITSSSTGEPAAADVPAASSVPVIDNDGFECEHGHVSSAKAGDLKLISQASHTAAPPYDVG